jgi:hypothetical protein
VHSKGFLLFFKKKFQTLEKNYISFKIFSVLSLVGSQQQEQQDADDERRREA